MFPSLELLWQGQDSRSGGSIEDIWAAAGHLDQVGTQPQDFAYEFLELLTEATRVVSPDVYVVQCSAQGKHKYLLKP